MTSAYWSAPKFCSHLSQKYPEKKCVSTVSKVRLKGLSSLDKFNNSFFAKS